MLTKISVIIVAYNSNEVIMPCLQSLHKFNKIGEALEVIVVDNNPICGLKKLLTENLWNFRLAYCENMSNNGFGGGNNFGVAHSTAPVLFFLNPDTILVEDVITSTLEIIEANPDVVVGYSLTDRKGGPNNSYSYFPEYLFLFPFFHLLERISPLWFINHWHLLNRIVWPWGAAFSLRKDRFVAAGQFDENIFLCNEEPDLMHRLPKRHVTILPKKIIHLEGHGLEVKVQRQLDYLRSLKYYLTKHHVKFVVFFWWLFNLKLKIKRIIRHGDQDNLDKAYELFVQEN